MVDFISHALWGGIAFGRRNRKVFLVAAGISILPDLLSEGLFGVLYMLGVGDMPAWDKGHPNITEFPLWAQTLYSGTHSMILFILVFLFIWAVKGKPVWLLGAWGLHIVIDIPTHSLELFPTPFLWPLSDFKVDGVDWSHPIVLGIDLLLLAVVYFLWMSRLKHQ